MVKINKKPAKSTSVKVGNKKQNKLNKQKQRTKKAAKNGKPDIGKNEKVFYKSMLNSIYIDIAALRLREKSQT